VAKKSALFAGRWVCMVCKVNGLHLIISGGLLHLTGSRGSILLILPFLQMGQTVTSIPLIPEQFAPAKSPAFFPLLHFYRLTSYGMQQYCLYGFCLPAGRSGVSGHSVRVRHEAGIFE